MTWPRALWRIAVAFASVPLLLAAIVVLGLRTGGQARLQRVARLLIAWLGRPDPGTGLRGLLAYLSLRLVPELVAALAVALLGIGVVVASIVVRAVITGELGPAGFLLQVAIGTVLLVLDLQVVLNLTRLDDWLAGLLLEPSERERQLEHRVDELSLSRSEVLSAIDDERRRIERDLHDGLQQRLVSLGIVLGRARRTGDEAQRLTLLAEAHDSAVDAVAELREVAWQVYPAALADAGLGEVLPVIAARAGSQAQVRTQLTGRLPPPVETALYYVASEAITNASKHAHARHVTIELTQCASMVRMQVTDDGVGGADPHGGGLSGLARRVEAVNGCLVVSSPAGGPTRVTAEVPCAW